MTTACRKIKISLEQTPFTEGDE